jgi:hypothetical protein
MFTLTLPAVDNLELAAYPGALLSFRVNTVSSHRALSFLSHTLQGISYQFSLQVSSAIETHKRSCPRLTRAPSREAGPVAGHTLRDHAPLTLSIRVRSFSRALCTLQTKLTLSL